ncbi:MAG: FkbM family methyltransferase [Ginsengibacter sp.]
MKPNEIINLARKIVAAFRGRQNKAKMVQHPFGGKVQQFECRMNSGVLIPIVPSLTSETIANSIRGGSYEAHEAALLGGLIQSGEVILEVGAGCGLISAVCAKNPHTSKVHCVEANPNLIDLIRMTHSLNGVNVVVHNELLAKQDGETDFYVHDDFWASGTHSFLGKPIKVKTTSFQKRLKELQPTMLVIDIEGGEIDLFDDVDLSGIRKIMIELHQPTIGRQGMKKVFDVLSRQNFHYDMWHSTYSVVTFSHVDRY